MEIAPADFHALESFAPQTIVAFLPDALALADRKLPSLDTALIVLTQLDESPLQTLHRERLWRAFRIPVFEQLQNSSGRVIARECEVHNGLHLDPSALSVSPINGEIVEGYCDCGSEAPRLIAVAPRKRAAAAG